MLGLQRKEYWNVKSYVTQGTKFLHRRHYSITTVSAIQ
jgi:hypothetical protein